jgi:amino acid adenylation domain-containing protein
VTTVFRLPDAWRSVPADPSEILEAVVALEDLVKELGALADACDAEPPVVLLAAHLKVLSMLTEDRAFRSDVMGPDRDAAPDAFTMDGRAATWHQLVRRVARDAEAAGGRAARPVGPGSRPDQVLFAVATGSGSGVGARSAAAYGLDVVAEERLLRLRARNGALTTGYLARLAQIYRSVLESMASGPEGDAAAAYLPPDERRAVLHEWGTGETVDHGEHTVVELFQAQAADTPDVPAVRMAGGALTYRELEENSNRIAHHLIFLGARADTLVGVCLRRTTDLLPVLLGVWKSGAGYLPLDPDLPAARLRRMIGGAGCVLVVTDTEHVPVLGTPDGALDRGRFVLMSEDRDAIAARPPAPPGIPADPGRLAYVIYTSGSTGDPKGVMVEHRGLVNYLRWTAGAYAACGTGGSAFFSSISVDLQIPCLFTPLLTGQPVHLLPDPLDIADLGDLLAEGAPYSFLKMTPGQLDLLSLDLTPDQIHGLAGIVVAAGDAFTGELARRWARFAGPGGTVVATEYGPTEITIGNSGQPVTEPPGTELVPLGAPIPNTTMYVLTDRLEPVPVGVPGEVHVGGAGVARGYLNSPALTADRFVPDPYGPPGSRLYRTGDRARWRADGALEFLGRVDHQVKIHGHRVELGEIQANLRRHPEVGEVVVIACGSVRAQSIAAFVVPAPGRAMDAAGLRAHLAGNLPSHMIPAHFAAVDRVPLTANGKVDTRALRSLLAL